MKNTVAALVFGLTFFALGAQMVYSDDDGNSEYGHWKNRNPFKRTVDVAPVGDPLYREECGSCHMVYPAGLLPARSWRAVMARLDSHFGDNAEMEEAVQMKITEYLVANSADKSPYRRSKKIMRRLSKTETPLSISRMRYFRHEHDEIPARMVTGNDKVAGISNCVACHVQAEEGSFRENEINIPGHGHWDD